MQRLHLVCAVEGCGREHKSRGYCPTHYAQVRRGFVPSPVIKSRDRNKPDQCVEVNCQKPVKAKGMCATHYARFLRHGHTRYRDRVKPPKPCRIAGCDNILYSKSLCNAHYLVERNWGPSGLGVDAYVAKSETQGGVCLICSRPETAVDKASGKVRALAVDHDHKTGRIRGLLCSACNRALGLFQDDPELLAKAADYLLHFRQLPS